MAATETTLNPRAVKGFSQAALYDKHRPVYLEEAVSFLLESLRVAKVPSATLMDLAAGTGKFTELLASRPEEYKTIAVDPHDEMRGVLEAKKLRNVQTMKGMAHSMPDIQSESVDAVVASQSFHWFATLETLEEIYRVLKPDGVFGMIWNIESYNAPKHWDLGDPWEHKLRDLMWEAEDGAPRFRHEKWRAVFDEQLQSTPLSIISSADPIFSLPIGEKHFSFETKLTKEDVWNRYRTISQIANLEGEQLERARKVFTETMDAKDVEYDTDDKVAVHGYSVVAWTSKIPGRPLREGG